MRGPWRVAALAALTLAWRAPPAVRALFRGGDGPVESGPPPAPMRRDEADDCASCHADIASEWRASAHAHAWDDPIFQASYTREPDAFCRHCHAPRMRAGNATPDARARREGVSCAVCHVRAGQVLNPRRTLADATPRDHAHAFTLAPVLGESAFCGGCHQFDFPSRRDARGAVTHAGEPMQDTLGEWSRSDLARRGETCASCHMPLRRNALGAVYRSHDFSVMRDPGRLRAALRVRVTARASRAETAVSLRLEGGVIGHAFPTGDLFREGEVRAWVEGAPATLRTQTLSRRYGATVHGRRTEVADTRVPAPGGGPAREVTLRLPALPAGTEVRWAVDHLRMSPVLATRLGVGDAQNRTPVIRGVVYVPGAPSGDARTTAPP